MADVRQCKDTLPHAAHQWTTRLSRVNGIPEVTLQYHHCPGKASADTSLAGATREPALGVVPATAGEFAAIWNGRTTEQREQMLRSINASGDTAAKCWQADHEGLERELQSIREQRARVHSQPLRESIENLLADELYDGGMGYLGDEPFLKYRNGLAGKLAELVGEYMSHEKTVNVLRADWDRVHISDPEQDEPLPKESQWYAYWTGVHQAVQHWADGSQMACPYPTPTGVVKDLVEHLLDEAEE
ncbi:hypothetical protein SEA_KATCHAN_56 [Microbacterium phage KatChan]|nr:hypothetical protein SEA_KATCHAN_56 [Microbacterium phage KatChan]